jgi:hypothetical protein
LANVHWTLANTSCGLSPLANVRLLSVGESLIGEIREPHGTVRQRQVFLAMNTKMYESEQKSNFASAKL